ncbi:MAG: hypothetical protein AAF889_00435 [Cyanobacteria bacterium P01_D01_bin.73]
MPSSIRSRFRPRSKNRFADRIGRWNPQLLRELRSNLTVKSALLAIAVSLGLQMLVGYWGISVTVPVHHWHDKALFFSRWVWLLSVTLMGSFAIISNWSRETELGTLDFLRLSPQPAWRILLGKLLGAPVLCHVATLAWLPFHLYLVFNSSARYGDWMVIDLFYALVAIAFLTTTLNLSIWRGKINPLLTYAVVSFAVIVTVTFGSLTVWYLMAIVHRVVYPLPLHPLPAALISMAILAAYNWSSACYRFRDLDLYPKPEDEELDDLLPKESRPQLAVASFQKTAKPQKTSQK